MAASSGSMTSMLGHTWPAMRFAAQRSTVARLYSAAANPSCQISLGTGCTVSSVKPTVAPRRRHVQTMTLWS